MTSRQKLKHRIAFGLGANTVGKIWVLLAQLVTVPILVSKWGAQGYGVWLMLTALPTYIALSDFGFGTAAAVTMTAHVASRDLTAALRTFQSVWSLISVASAVILIMTGLALAAVSEWEPGLLPGWGGTNIVGAIIILLIYSLLVLQMSVINVVFRATMRYAQGTFFLDLLLPIETSALIGVALIGGRYLECTAVMLLVRGIGLVIYHSIIRKYEPWLKIGWSEASLVEIRALTRPALAALALPLSTALMLQGVIVTVGLVIGPAAAGAFGVVRTVTRLPLQLTAIVTRATLPELTMARTTQNVVLANQLAVFNLAAVAAIGLPLLLSIPFGTMLVSQLTHGRMHVPTALYAAMSATSLFQAGWNTVLMFLFAVNKQQKVVFWALLFSTLATLSPLAMASNVGIVGIAATLAALDLFMLIVVIAVWRSEEAVTASDLRSAAGHIWGMLLKRAVPLTTSREG